MSEVRATVRLQFNKDFTLDDAVPLVDYFARLGISHIYASPLLTSRRGSTHGYDAVDPTSIDPEVGGEDALRRLVTALRARDMGLVLDVVPNHMGVGSENAWWMDVLEKGPDSRYAKFFDINWHPADPALENRILAPFLGGSYGDALEAGDLRLVHDERTSKFFIAYYEHRFPIRSEDQARLRESGRAPDDVIAEFQGQESHEKLQELIDNQHYRLAWWRTAADEINWRRFFDIGGLAAVRVEEPEVFEATHELIFRLYAEGLVDGLRVDHVDGLADPGDYCRTVRARLEQLHAHRPPEAQVTRPLLLVEKILAPGEQLRDDWGVDGTTGYDFMNDVSAVLHDENGAAPLVALWHEATGVETDFATEVRSARRQILLENFEGDLTAAAAAFHAIARSDIATADISLASIRRVLIELLVVFPVYRTYTDGTTRSETDGRIIAESCAAALEEVPVADRPVIELIDAWLGGTPPADDDAAALRRVAARRFQQLTSPLAAKAVEDTAMYRYGPLLSRNEVGAEPSEIAIPVDAFHAACAQRRARFPRNLLATATHDHKRGEDVRARLAVLSEIAEEWTALVHRWMALNGMARKQLEAGPAPSPADEMMLYQTLVGFWPPGTPDDRELDLLIERAGAWQVKAAREAKLGSGWTEPNEEYETAITGFLRDILQSAEFHRDIASVVSGIAPAGALNGLAQTVLRMTTPGIPDLYQGTEFWDFSLVDPDNRRPVDFEARAAALALSKKADNLLTDWRDGRLKQAVIAATLCLRAENPRLFADGSYEPLDVTGPLAGHAIAFRRAAGDTEMIVVVSRCAAGLLERDGLPLIPPHRWAETALDLQAAASRPFRDIFSGREIVPEKGALPLKTVLADLPVALLA